MHQCGGGSSDNEPKLGMPIVDTFPLESTASPDLSGLLRPLLKAMLSSIDLRVYLPPPRSLHAAF